MKSNGRIVMQIRSILHRVPKKDYVQNTCGVIISIAIGVFQLRGASLWKHSSYGLKRFSNLNFK